MDWIKILSETGGSVYLKYPSCSCKRSVWVTQTTTHCLWLEKYSIMINLKWYEEVLKTAKQNKMQKVKHQW